MKSLLTLFAALVIAGASFAKDVAPTSWDGYVIDKACATSIMKKKLPADKANAKVVAHTKECAMMEDCVKSGYGIWTNGKYILFDESGNKKVGVLLTHTDKKDNLAVTVKGTMKGNKIAVSGISTR